MKYSAYILDLYDEVKKKNISDHPNSDWQPDPDPDLNDQNQNPEPDEEPDELPHDDDDVENEDEIKESDELQSPNVVVRRTARSSDSSSSSPLTLLTSDSFKLLNESIYHDFARNDRIQDKDAAKILFTPVDLTKKIVHRKLTGADILKMMPANATINKESKYYSNHIFNQQEECNYTLASDANLEFYFTSAHKSAADLLEKYDRKSPSSSKQSRAANVDYLDMSTEYSVQSDQTFRSILDDEDKLKYLFSKEENLLNINKLKSLCQWDKKMLSIMTAGKKSNPHQQQQQKVCYFSLPQAIAILSNKSDCMQLVPADVRAFLHTVKQCHALYEQGVLFAAAEEYKQKMPFFSLLDKNKPISNFIRFPTVRDNICFKNNLIFIVFDYLIDKEFLVNETNLNVKISTLLILNTRSNHTSGESTKQKSPKTRENKLFNENYIYDIYLKHFHEALYADDETRLEGINLIGIRQEAAMRFITQEMMLVALAITLIVIVTLLYLKSIFISMIVNFGVAMSVGVAFFAYRIVFDIELFPFINMMAAFLLIGIACDNVYVLFDSWYNEKGKIILEDLPDMIQKQYRSSHSNGNNKLNQTNDSNPVVAVEDADADDPATGELILPPIFIKRRFVNGKNKSIATATTKHKNNAGTNHHLSNKSTAENETFINLNLNKLNQKSASEAAAAADNANEDLLNTTATELLIVEKGIAAIDINEFELNPSFVRYAPLTDEQMVRVMGGTLRHAASSIFVTSFTTAAAFLTNYITKLPYVQLFGVFTGICILVYFSMVITMVAAFVISYEKFIQPFRCKVQTRHTRKMEALFQKWMDTLALLNYRVISQMLPTVLIKFRVVFFTLFLGLGVAGMLAVFYHPKLEPPTTWRYQFFKKGNLFENFEFNVKDHFWSYVNEEKRNLTNPEIFFIFGIIDKDNGRIFNPDDDGHLVYDKKFDFYSRESQVWLNEFINQTLASRRDLFLVDEIVAEWSRYLKQMAWFCQKSLQVESLDEVRLPFDPHSLKLCRDEINGLLANSSVANFESMMSMFPRLIVFMTDGRDVTALLLRVKANRTFVNHDTVRDYYMDLSEFHRKAIAPAPDGFQTGWFISVAFALYDLQYQLITGTYSSLVASMAIALIILLLTSGNIIISLFAIVTISFSIADTIAIFVLMDWNLSILESVIIIMSVGLSVDFSCHYGVAYIKCDTDFSYIHAAASASAADETVNSDGNENGTKRVKGSTKKKKNKNNNNKCSLASRCVRAYQRSNQERFMRIHDIFERVGSAVIMAAFTTFLAGFSMSPSSLISFTKMGQFLMLVMCLSYIYATFFFVPMCALFGPTQNFGSLRLKDLAVWLWRACTFCFREGVGKEDKDRKKSSQPPTAAPLLLNSSSTNDTNNKSLIYNNTVHTSKDKVNYNSRNSEVQL